MGTRLMLISLWAEDVEKTAHFYKEVLKLPSQAHHGAIPHFDIGNATLVILQGTPSPVKESKPDRFPIIALTIENFKVVIDRLVAQQIVFPWGIESDGQTRWVMFYDPGGNLIELVEG